MLLKKLPFRILYPDLSFKMVNFSETFAEQSEELSTVLECLDFHMPGPAKEFCKPNLTIKVHKTVLINNFFNNQNMELLDMCSSINIFLTNRNLC